MRSLATANAVAASSLPVASATSLRGCRVMADGRVLGPDRTLCAWIQPDGVLIGLDGSAVGLLVDVHTIKALRSIPSKSETAVRVIQSRERHLAQNNVPQWVALTSSATLEQLQPHQRLTLTEHARSLLNIPTIAELIEKIMQGK